MAKENSNLQKILLEYSSDQQMNHSRVRSSREDFIEMGLSVTLFHDKLFGYFTMLYRCMACSVCGIIVLAPH
jgi:hypothetical protein